MPLRSTLRVSLFAVRSLKHRCRLMSLIFFVMREGAHTLQSFRIAVLILIGVALVTSWLQPVYETAFVRGAVIVPKWWAAVHLTSLGLLFFVLAVLSMRKSSFARVCWLGLIVSLAGSLIPGFA